MKTKVFKGTWLQRPGTSTVHHLDSNRSGLRVIEHQWADEATVTVSIVAGDAFRNPDGFVYYLKVEGVEPGQGEVLARSI